MTNEVNDKGVFLNEVYTDIKKLENCNVCFKSIDPNSLKIGCDRVDCKYTHNITIETNNAFSS
jgi:hypothetical protein